MRNDVRTAKHTVLAQAAKSCVDDLTEILQECTRRGLVVTPPEWEQVIAGTGVVAVRVLAWGISQDLLKAPPKPEGPPVEEVRKGGGT